MKLGAIALVGLMAPLAGQARAPRSAGNPALLREELRRVQAQQERLLQLRIRHDLGLPVQADTYLALTEAERARAKPEAEQQLAEEQSRVATLNERFQELAARVTKANEQAAQVATDPDLDFGGPTLTPPTPEPFAMADEAKPVPEAHPAPAVETAATRDGPPPVLLRGSEDHSRVGRALYQAKKFDRARAELEQAIAKTPDLVDMFWLARSCEALGDYAKASELYLQVEAKDTKEVDNQPKRGEWARSARVARMHMEWMQNQGQWKPQPSVESVQWRKR